ARSGHASSQASGAAKVVKSLPGKRAPPLTCLRPSVGTTSDAALPSVPRAAFATPARRWSNGWA
ncbi:MAG: hypothetical protein M3O50_17485, partial [Myxococcota bacterium]|nr:hypothetical protein [Myxococcota bacterium]